MNRLILLLALIVPASLLAQNANTEISKGRIFEGEPFLVINPTNPKNMVAAWMSFKLIGNPVTIATRSTFDGGVTWNDTILLPHRNAAWQSADVSMAWRSDGVLFLSYIDYLDSSNTDGGVFVVSSTDGGRTFSVPVQALDATEDSDVSLDRPWLAVDNSDAASKGNLYICTKPAPWNPLPNHAYLTRSTDSGQHWSQEMVLDSTPYPANEVDAPMGSPVVANDGSLYIAYPFYQGLKAGFALAVSQDGGQSFTRSFLIQPVEDFKEKDSIKGGFHIIADPTNPRHLVFAWPDDRNGDYDVFAVTSTDAGGTWSQPERVNDDPVGNGVVQDMIWPTFGPNW
ncbi:MAG TPA: sialidase family protein [Candidatus Kapabacteria bacterium]